MVLTIQGHAETVPIIGVQNPVTSLSGLAGMYNYVSTSCANASYGVPNKSGCNTNYGTLKIDSAGNYYQCTQNNITSTPNCYNSQTSSGSQGTVSALDGGVFKYVKTGSNAVSYILAFNAPNGETVVIGDLNDPVYYGYGQFVASTQPASNLTTAQFSAQASGTWYYHDIYSDNSAPTRSGVSSGTHLLSGTGYTNADGTSGTSTINTPWAGFVTTSNANGSTGVTILAGTGVYVWRSSDSRVYEYQVGMHQ